MKSVIILVLPNQNPVSKSEGIKIRRAVKRELKDYATSLALNGKPEHYEFYDGDVVTFQTHDVNRNVYATQDVALSTLILENQYIKLN